VFVACEDPSPFASGRGLTWLRTVGVHVETGVLGEEAAPLYEAYRRRLHG
jgi:diaminohydroxyphosphoribosylaminopyrimidine deaminase/5-amino-6-(5-phosphoribosylamino)uracil reductase